MAMNIVKLQSQLQRIPDDALIGYVQNPQGQVPSYLALAELSRRKEIRASAAPQAPAPTQSVADQVVGEGLSALPVSEDMFQEESYAMGGIVSFADGGDVPGYARGGYMQLTKAQYDSLIPSEKQAYVNQWGAPPVGASSVSGLEAIGIKSKPSALQRVLSEGTPLRPEVQSVPSASSISSTPILPYVDPRMVADKNKKQILEDVAAGKYDTNPTPAGANTSGIKGLTWDEIKADPQGYRDMMRPEVSAQEKMAEMQGLIGIDPARAAMNERLAKMEARTAKEEETAPWMALANAGLGMAAGKSQFAIQNIAEGAKSGLADLAAAKERVNTAKEKQFEIASRMAQADRAEKVASAKFGAESAEAIKARNDQIKLAEQSNKNEIALKNAVGKFDAQKGNAEIQLKKADLAQTAAANAAKLKVMERQIVSQGLASQAKFAAIRQKALADLKNNDSYNARINALLKKYKDSGGVENPLYKQEVQSITNEFMANSLETIFDTGLSANALSAEEILASS